MYRGREEKNPMTLRYNGKCPSRYMVQKKILFNFCAHILYFGAGVLLELTAQNQNQALDNLSKRHQIIGGDELDA